MERTAMHLGTEERVGRRDAEHMPVSSTSIVWLGPLLPARPADLGELRRRVQQWRDWAPVNSILWRLREASCN